MSNKGPPKFKSRNIGLVILMISQILVGGIHVFFALWLLTSPKTIPMSGAVSPLGNLDIYSVYTLIFGLLSATFGSILWMQKREAWIGTFSILVFVIVADTLTLLDLPSIPGIPKIAGFGEISYSIIVIAYILQSHVRKTFGIMIH